MWAKTDGAGNCLFIEIAEDSIALVPDKKLSPMSSFLKTQVSKELRLQIHQIA